MHTFNKRFFAISLILLCGFSFVSPAFAQTDTELFCIEHPIYSHDRIDSVLNKVTDYCFDKISLEDLLHEVATDHILTIRLHRSAVQSGMSLDDKVTEAFADTPLHEILCDLASTHDCTISIRNSAVQFVSNQFAIENGEVRVYECQKLIDKKFEGNGQTLLDSIRTKVAKGSWRDFDGKASIVEFDNMLIIRQTYANHCRIKEHLLDMAK